MGIGLPIFNRAFRAVRALNRDENGFVLIFSAFLIPVLLFGTGLVVDVSSLLQERSKAQYAAHFAAVAGAEVLGTQGGTLAQAQGTALAIAARNGYATGVTANRPGSFSPSYGNFTDASANPYALEVRIDTQRTNAFGALFNKLVTPIPVRAVANYGPALPCIVVLNTGSGINSGVNLNGVNASLIAPCGLYINSSDASTALNANTGSNKVCASATDPNVMGIVSMNGGSTGQYRSGVCPGMKLMSNQGTVVNPYAYLSTTLPSTLSGLSAGVPTASTYRITATSNPQNNCSYTVNNTSTKRNASIGNNGSCSATCPNGLTCTSYQYYIDNGYYQNGLRISASASDTIYLDGEGNYNFANDVSLTAGTIVSDSENTISIVTAAGTAANLTVNASTRATLNGNYYISGTFASSSAILNFTANAYIGGDFNPSGPAASNTNSFNLGAGNYYVGGNFNPSNLNSAAINPTRLYLAGGMAVPSSVTNITFNTGSGASTASIYNVGTATFTGNSSVIFGGGDYYFGGTNGTRCSDSGLQFSSVPSATLQSGQYYLGGSGLCLTSSAVTTSTFPSGPNGVTIALTNASTGTVTIGASSSLRLNAPTTSATNSPRYAGFAVVQSPPAATGNPVNGGATTANSLWLVNGIAVLPNTNLQFSGGNSSSACSGFVVWTLTISGNSSITNGCQNTGGNTTALKSAIPAE